jgi:uncharacterized sulfatase
MTVGRPARPNIVLIVLDTLRADRLSCYGYPAATTPHLDAFAEKGTLFERAISPAQWTIPAHGSLFTGELPSAHGTTQIYDHHTSELPTLAELLGASGYRTAGFCNNPLLGIVDNGLDRGFQEFYNYGGVLPNRPNAREAGPVRRMAASLGETLAQLNAPMQALFTRNIEALGFVLHPWLVALWERNINFKGNTRQSIADLTRYLKQHATDRDAAPLFVYLNLMETHLPYKTPAQFSRKFAPIYHEDREARRFMQSYNFRTYDWITPIVEPFSETQHRVLNDMYDAEVAYEDRLLAPLLDQLDDPAVRDNTLVIIMSDHGEGLDHHNFVGHSLVTYEDLIRVPLILRYPPHYPAGERITTPISTRRLYHTVLDAAGIIPGDVVPEAPGNAAREISRLSLRRESARGTASGDAPSDVVCAEAYPPITMVRLLESRNPEAVERFRCHAVRRAIYQGGQKLITIDETPEELYNVREDPAELDNRIDEHRDLAARLDRRLRSTIAQARAERPRDKDDSAPVNLDDQRRVSDRLRHLGYIE